MTDKYILEVRDSKGVLDFKLREQKERAHPDLFTKRTYTMDQLCHYMSYGQKRDKPSGPLELPAFMESIGIQYRMKSWPE